MNKLTVGIIGGFIAGAVTGSCIIGYLQNKKHNEEKQKEIQNEIDKFIKDFEEHNICKKFVDEYNGVEEAEVEPTPEETKPNEEPTSLGSESIDYNSYSKNSNNLSEEDEEHLDSIYKENPEVIRELPYPFDPDLFDTSIKYTPNLLYYYNDGVLADEDGNIVTDFAGTVGFDFEDTFGDYDDEVTCIRNDITLNEYKISIVNCDYDERDM